jgi:hypothetical protein
MRRIGSGKDQFACHGKSVFIGSFKHERASVSHQRSVKAGGNVAIDGNAGHPGQPVDELGGRHYGGVDPVDMSEVSTAGVMVNINEKAFFEPLKKRAARAVAFEQNYGITRRHGIRLNYQISKGKILVDARDAVMHDHDCILPHDPQNLSAG